MNYGGNNLLFYFEAVFPPLSVKVQGILFKYLVVFSCSDSPVQPISKNQQPADNNPHIYLKGLVYSL